MSFRRRRTISSHCEMWNSLSGSGNANVGSNAAGGWLAI